MKKTTDTTKNALNIAEMSMEETLTIMNSGNCPDDVKAHAEELAKQATKEKEKEYVSRLIAMENKSDAMKEFIARPFYDATRLSQNKKTRDWEFQVYKRQFSFYALEHAYQCSKSTGADDKGNPIPNKATTFAVDPKWEIYLKMFLDNVAIATSEELKAKPVDLTDPNVQHKKENGMSGYGVKALEDQLRKVCAALVPEEILPKMLKQDAVFIREASTRVKSDTVQFFNEKSLLDTVFMALKVRSENGDYKFISKAKCHRAKKI